MLFSLARFLLFALIFCVPVFAAEEPRAPAVIIIDSSGSMAARMDGATRLDAARTALGALLDSWPADAPVALVAYGHRRTADCADIETIAPLGPLDRARANKRLNGLRARGKTPLTASLQHAAGVLGPSGGGDIVLVSDGAETCAPDPCAAAEALHAANVRVRIYVVGFGVTGAETEQLRCIAEKGGGKYYPANDAAALTGALGAAAEAAATAPPPEPPQPEPAPPPPPAEPEPAPIVPMGPLPVPPLPGLALPALTPPPAPAIFPVTFQAVLGEGGPLLDFPVDWTIRSADDGDFRYEGNARALGLELPEGRYIAAVRFANAAGEREIELQAQPGAAIDVPVIAGEVRLGVTTSARAAKLGDGDQAGIAWTLDPLEGQGAVTIAALAAPTLVLAPGRYRAGVTAQGERAAAELTVRAGQSQETLLNLALGKLTLEAATKEDGDPITANQGIAWTLTSTADPARIYERVQSARPSLTVPAGDYTATLRIGGGTIAAPVSVTDGQDETTRIVVPVSKVKLTAALAPGEEPFTDWRDTMWTVKALSVIGLADDTALMQGMPAANPEFDMLPGRYIATVTGRIGQASATVEFDVAPGEPLEKRIDLNAAFVTIRGSPPVREGGDAEDAMYEIAPLDASGEPGRTVVGLVQNAPIEAVLPPGRYRVTVTLGAAIATKDITLAIGDRTTFEIIPAAP